MNNRWLLLSVLSCALIGSSFAVSLEDRVTALEGQVNTLIEAEQAQSEQLNKLASTALRLEQAFKGEAGFKGEGG